MDQADKARRLLADTDTSLVDLATELGFPNYRAFAAWTRRRFGMGPRELREGKPARLGRDPVDDPASEVWQTRCTVSERETIAAAVPALAERWECSHGAAVARALTQAKKDRGR